MTIKELTDNLERIKDGLSDVDNRYGIDGTLDDISILIDKVEEEGISGDPEYGGGCCTITLNPEGEK